MPRSAALAGRRLRGVVPVLVIGASLALVPFPTCILKLSIGVPCPACGLTRAAIALAKLDLAAATSWHPLAIPLALVTLLTAICALTLADAAWNRFVVHVSGGVAIALLFVWATRFLGFFGGPVP